MRVKSIADLFNSLDGHGCATEPSKSVATQQMGHCLFPFDRQNTLLFDRQNTFPSFGQPNTLLSSRSMRGPRRWTWRRSKERNVIRRRQERNVFCRPEGNTVLCRSKERNVLCRSKPWTSSAKSITSNVPIIPSCSTWQSPRSTKVPVVTTWQSVQSAQLPKCQNINV